MNTEEKKNGCWMLYLLIKKKERHFLVEKNAKKKPSDLWVSGWQSSFFVGVVS